MIFVGGRVGSRRRMRSRVDHMAVVLLPLMVGGSHWLHLLLHHLHHRHRLLLVFIVVDNLLIVVIVVIPIVLVITVLVVLEGIKLD